MGRQRVLVADDSVTVRTLICTFLASKNFEVCEAVDGLDAVAKVKTFKPDLILLDLRMSPVDGMEAASILTRTRPNIPVLLFTMHENVEEKPTLAAGVDLVLSMPDGMNKLVESVQDLLRGGSENPVKPPSARC